jgi:hypothetical protein
LEKLKGEIHFEDKRRWKDNIRIELREIGWDCAERNTWRPVEATCENGNEISCSIKVGDYFTS